MLRDSLFNALGFGLSRHLYNFEFGSLKDAIFRVIGDSDFFSKRDINVAVPYQGTKNAEIRIWDSRYCDFNKGAYITYSRSKRGKTLYFSIKWGYGIPSNEKIGIIKKYQNIIESNDMPNFLKDTRYSINDSVMGDIILIKYRRTSGGDASEKNLVEDLKNVYDIYGILCGLCQKIGDSIKETDDEEMEVNAKNNISDEKENKLLRYFMNILNFYGKVDFEGDFNRELPNSVKNNIIKLIFDILNGSKSFPSLTNHFQIYVQEGIKNKNGVNIYIWDNRYFDSTFEQGIYIIYSFSISGESFSLSIGQGKKFPSSDKRKVIVGEFRQNIINREYAKNYSLETVNDFLNNVGREEIVYKNYKKGNFDGKILSEDLEFVFKLYKELYESYKLKLDELNVIFYEYLSGRGYFFDKRTIENYLLSLKVKPFAILTGNSGTGKTKLSQLFAEYLEGDNKNNNAIVPVGANWTENRNVVGYYNVLTKDYQHTPSLDLILKAKEHGDEPYFLILDEMNLSHVERYFSDFLSSMESGKPIPLHKAEDVADVPQELTIPSNVFIVGTVNVDETTYMFSPKVLDRANVLEFKTFEDISMRDYVKRTSPEIEFKEDVDYLENPLSDIGLRENILSVVNGHFSDIKCNVTEIIENDDGVAEAKIVESHVGLEISRELTKFNGYLAGSGFEFGYRTVNEILAFMYVAWKYEGEPDVWDNWRRYFDAQILQKILPKLHGSQIVLGETLDNLLAHCLGIDSVDEIDDLSKLDLDELNVPYLESAKKLIQMKNVLEKQRYVSFIN